MLGGWQVGEAKLHKGYRLPARFVIHTVAQSGTRQQRRAGTGWLPATAGALQVAAIMVHTASHFSISTGVYGYPWNWPPVSQLKTVSSSQPQLSSIREVIFCCFSASDLAVYQRLIHATHG